MTPSGKQAFIDTLARTQPRHYHRPSRRADAICWAVIILASLYFALQIAVAARAGNW